MEDKKAKAKWIIGIVGICIAIYVGLQHLDRVVWAVRWLFRLFVPLVMGGAVAFVINVPLRPLERHFFPNSTKHWVGKLRRPCCIVLAILIILGMFAGVGVLVIPELVSAFSILGHSISSAAQSLQQLNLQVYGENSAIMQFIDSLDINWADIQAAVIDWVKNSAMGVVDSTVSVVSRMVSSVINFAVSLVFGIYIVLNGHLSPGGGFSGGAVLGSGLILYLNAFGFQKTERFFTEKIYRRITLCALTFYCMAKSYSFFTGANHLKSGIPLGTPGTILSSGLILPLNICVGLVVACTMYAFYALFRKGGM